MKAKTYAVGQVLYFRASDSRRAEHRHGKHEFEMTIEALGRKWLTVTPGVSNRTARVDRETLAVEGYMRADGQCYRTEQARAEAIDSERLWSHLQRGLRDMPRPPASVDSHAIRQVLGRLGLKQPEDPSP